MLLTMLFFFLALSSGSVILSTLTTNRYESALPLTVMAITFVLYAFYLFNILYIGFWCVIGLCALCYAVSAFFIIKRRSLRAVASRLVTPGFAIFLIIYVFLFFRLNNWIVMYWDELRVWGAMPKILFYSNAWLNGNTLMYPGLQSVPLAMAQFQYFLLRLNGSFKEGYLFIAYTVFSLSFVMPAMKSVRWKQYWLVPILSVCILILPMMFYNSNFDYNNFYTNIFIDAALGMVFGYALSVTVLEKELHPLPYCSAAMAVGILPLMKDSGYFLAIIAAIVLAIDLFVFKRNAACNNTLPLRSKRRHTLAVIFTSALLLMVPMLTKFIWNVFKAQFHLKTVLLSDSQLENIQSAIHAGGTLLVKFLYVLQSVPIISRAWLPPRNLTYDMILPGFILLFAIVLIALPKQARKRFLTLASIVLAMNIVYVAGLYFLYASKTFGAINGLHFPSYQRYMSTALLGTAVFLFASIVSCFTTGREALDRKDVKRRRIALAAVTLLLIGITPFSTYAGVNYLFAGDINHLQSNPYHDRSKVEDAVKTIRASVDATQRRQNVFLVIQGNETSNALYHHMIYFQLLSDNIFIKNYYTSTNVTLSDELPQEMLKASELQWVDSLRGYDYVYLYKIDADFIYQCSTAFVNGSADIAANRLYKVLATDDGIKLVYIP